MEQILTRVPEAMVAVAGEYVYGETERVSREAWVLVVRWAGCPGNVALDLAALGVSGRAVGAISTNPLRAALSNVLEPGGVDISGRLRVLGRLTEAKSRVLAGGGSTRRQQWLRLDRCPKAPLRASVEGAGRARGGAGGGGRRRAYVDLLDGLRLEGRGARDPRAPPRRARHRGRLHAPRPRTIPQCGRVALAGGPKGHLMTERMGNGARQNIGSWRRSWRSRRS